MKTIAPETPASGSDTSTALQDAALSVGWGSVLDQAVELALTEPGKDLIAELEDPLAWAQNRDQAQVLQKETQEVLQLLDRDGLWGPLSELIDLSDSFERLDKGAALELRELKELRRWLYAIDSWVQTPRDPISAELFKKDLMALFDPYEIIRLLEKILTPDGELSEKASPLLASLFSEIRSLRREIHIEMDRVVKTFTASGVLQDSVSDLRDGRYVVPVKISHQRDIDGIVYEASASRQTVFVEPREVHGLNNRLRQKQNDLIQEIDRILKETSDRIRPHSYDIEKSIGILAYWDSVHARAAYGQKIGGKTIEVSEVRAFKIKQTAHPLLWSSMPHDQIIRNDIELNEPTLTLMITGPNTGGKTVLLKTLGLAGVFARTGFTIPAIGNPEVPFFESIFADLGDSQSIEENVSSFSGHVFKFKEILEQSTERCLILLDELNTATDPEEGAALGRAFLETLMGRGSMIVTTTHDPKLKALSLNDPRILTASMKFDESSRTPVFKLMLGIPGRSRALETASRLGLPESVLELARSYLSSEHSQFESFLGKLERESLEAERLRKESLRLFQEADAMKREWTEKTKAQVADVLEKTKLRLKKVIEQAQDQVRNTVKQLDEAKNRREIDQTRSELSDRFREGEKLLEKSLAEEAPELAALLKSESDLPDSSTQSEKPTYSVGDWVRIPKWKSTGQILEISQNGAKLKVQMGTVQMTLTPSEVEKTDAKRPPKNTKKYSTPDTPTPESRLDLRGVRFEEAMMELERYLDQAFRSRGLREVTIVHGLGTGAIREGTRKLLKKLPYIKEYRDGGVGGGGSGATIVEFDF